MALSKIIDFNGAANENEKKGLNSPGNVGETDDDLQEILTLIEELNKHQDLTVKLNNQSKICNIF